jgi:hypothetical protein
MLKPLGDCAPQEKLVWANMQLMQRARTPIFA